MFETFQDATAFCQTENFSQPNATHTHVFNKLHVARRVTMPELFTGKINSILLKPDNSMI